MICNVFYIGNLLMFINAERGLLQRCRTLPLTCKVDSRFHKGSLDGSFGHIAFLQISMIYFLPSCSSQFVFVCKLAI